MTKEMVKSNIRKLLKLEHLLLLAVLGLAFYMAFIPHLDYPYPLHLDEWVHMASAESMLSVGSASFPDPFHGYGTTTPTSNFEAGFQLFLGVFQAVSGMPWIEIFRYLPAALFTITVLAVYIVARRDGFGWEAAFFTALIPTTVGILGPAFLVPVAMGLLFTPLYLFLAFNFRSIWSYFLMFFFTAFLLSIHAPSAISPIIVLIPYILINLKSNFKHSLGMTLALILPFVVVFPWIKDLLVPTIKGLFTPVQPTDYVQLPRVIKTYGYIPSVFALLGALALAVKGNRRSYGLVLGLLALLLMLVTFFTFHHGIPILYERGLTFLMLMLSILAGAGLAAVKDFKLPDSIASRLKATELLARNTGKVLCLAAVVITLFIAIPSRLSTPYYHLIDREDYEAFVFIRDNVGQEYKRAILDPSKATAFVAVTSREVYTRIHAQPEAADHEAYEFLALGSSNSTFLKERGISLVYTRVYNGMQSGNVDYPSKNPDLVKVAKNIYLLKD